MLRGIIPSLTIILVIGGTAQKAQAQDPSARCVWIGNEQMTIASAEGHGLDIEDFTEVETATFVKAFNAMPPTSNFVANKIFAAVGRDRVYVFFENGEDLCTPPFALSLESYPRRLSSRRGGTALNCQG
jgi:hypothetical protein